uniref:ATP synthase complex subunit 8 n=1 Tax=Litostylus pudens TaxID=2480748 RepID=A0A3G2JZ90_9CUCU|nr:ATP synthase F0 subunit 8 [Litostylus pudens]
MPQMAPINWLSLYFIFIVIFLIFIIINYYSFSYSSKITIPSSKKILLNWKW